MIDKGIATNIPGFTNERRRTALEEFSKLDKTFERWEVGDQKGSKLVEFFACPA
jgi:hypothetical protein